jgi:hypothetical protein
MCGRMTEPNAPDSRQERDESPAPTALVTTHDDSLIDAQLQLSPADRLRALQSFVEDVIKMRDGRRPSIR